MIRMTLAEAASLAGGRITGEDASASPALAIRGVSTDTRTIRAGNLFVPLIGERFNGHAYASAALAAGAAAILWQEDQGEPPAAPAIVVDDTLAALQRLAAGYRRTLGVKVVAITGSNGKTTTKDMTAAALGAAFRVQKTQGNLNNHIGLPMTLLALEPDTQFAVLEMGMSDFGEIELLSGIARPDAAMITNIGDSHLLQLGSRDGIARAKLEIASGLAEGGILVVPGEEPLIDKHLGAAAKPSSLRVLRFGEGEACDVRLRSVELTQTDTTFRIEGSPESFAIPMLGRHNAHNASAAIAVARAFGVSDENIAAGLRAFSPTGMRIERVTGKRGTTLWNDAYNASPTSMRAALALLTETSGYRRKIAVLGDMLELGSGERELHRAVGRSIDPSRIDMVYTFGELGRDIAEAASARFPAGAVVAFDSKEELADRLERMAEAGDLILVKASRGMRLETIIERMRETRA